MSFKKPRSTSLPRSPNPPSNAMNRRDFLHRTACLAATVAAPSSHQTALSVSSRKRMGISIASYAIRWQSETESRTFPAFQDAMDVLRHCQKLGAGGIQIGVRGWSEQFAGRMRDAREKADVYLEGQISLPRDAGDVARFESEVLLAREAGATILRTVCLRGRRYETFTSAEAFDQFRKDSVASLERAEPVVRRHRVRLAVENHKDWRVPELIDLLAHLSSEWVGVTLDTGNSISLLEDPMEVVAGLAPYAFTTHFKDMSVAPYEDGFLLSEVPLGQGFLDLQKIVAVCERYNPDITFNLEMITRDPLRIPCITEAYWETFDDISGRELAQALRLVREHGAKTALPGVSEKTPEDRLAFEEENVRASFTHASRHLGLV